jgi:hypothetical protein
MLKIFARPLKLPQLCLRSEALAARGNQRAKRAGCTWGISCSEVKKEPGEARRVTRAAWDTPSATGTLKPSSTNAVANNSLHSPQHK